MNTNHNMDSIFQQKINGLEMPFQAEDWALMEKMLENSFVEGQGNMKNEILGAERIIAEKMAAYSIEMMPADWELLEQNLNKVDFDASVANSLLQHEIAMPESDWADFEKELDIQNFDNQFQSLQTYEMPLEMGIWNELESDLGAASFENIFAEKLENLTQEMPKSDWEAMAQTLNQTSFDAAIVQHLQAHKMTFVPADWKLMEALLDENDKKPVAGFWDWKKVAILTSLLLAGGGAALLWNRFEGKEQPKAHIHDAKPSDKGENLRVESSSHSDKKEDEEVQNTESESVKVLPKTDLPKPEKSIYIQNKSNTLIYSPEKEANKHTKAYNGISPKAENVLQNVPPVIAPPKIEKIENAPSERNIPNLDKPKAIPTENILPKTEILVENNSPKVENKELPSKENPSIFSQKQSLAEIKAIYGISPLIAQNFRTDAHCLPAEKQKSNVNVALGWVAAPLQSIAELNSKGKNGFATGLRMEIGTEKWAVVTGALYADKRFETRYWKYSGRLGQNYEHLLRGHVQEIALPFLYKRNFALTKGFSLYGQGGWIPIITMKEDYEHADPTNPSNSGISDLSRMVMEKQEQFYHTYLGYAQVATGVQYKYKRVSAFVEPHFQWGIQRMSTEEKRMHSYGLGFGILYKVGK